VAQNDPKKKVPEPQQVELRDKNGAPLTRDVLIKATYYPGTKGKETIPLIMVHGWKGSRSEFDGLASALQRDQGYAILAVDLRGHGESTTVLIGNNPKPLEADRINPAHWEAMVESDLEACKQYLMDKHNNGELNIEKLGIIAADTGAVVAMNYAVRDWHWPILAGGFKQGQDVKCLILLSPSWNVEKGRLNMTAPLKDPVQSEIACYIIYGSERAGSAAGDSKRIHDALGRFHLKDPDSLLIYPIKTTLQGTKLLTVKDLGMAGAIAKIVDSRLGAVAIPWRDRTGPFE
jgi:pimeloyl-ACP methyl ester carboxylesterase